MRIPICLLLFACWLTIPSRAQSVPKADSVSHTDSPHVSFIQRLQEAGAHDRAQSMFTLGRDKVAIRQRMLLDELSRTARETKLYLKNSLSPATVALALDKVKASFAVMKDGIFIHKGTAQTERNLSVSSAILSQLIQETDRRKKQAAQYADNLVGFRQKIDSLLSDSVIYLFPTDSLQARKYLAHLALVVKEGNPVDNALNQALSDVQDLQNKVDDLAFELKSASEEIESYRVKLSYLTVKREFANLWDAVGFSRPLGEILRFSFAKERMALLFYVENSIGALLLMILFIFLLQFGIRVLKRRLQEHEVPEKELKNQLIIRSPLVSATIVVLSLYQFVFINAPFVFTCLIWIIEVICLQLLFRGFIAAYWLRFWRTLSVLFLLACGDNMILQASRGERWGMLFLSLTGVVYGCIILLRGHREELREKGIIYFVRFLVITELLAALCNMFGRYNLSKTLLSTGYIGVISAIIFIWVVRLINEGLGLAAAIYQRQEPGKRNFVINFNRVGSKSPFVLHVLLVVGWCIIISRNFYAITHLSEPIKTLLHADRSIGSYNFSIYGIVLFVSIMLSALVLSKIVSFFAADADAQPFPVATATKSKRASVGSWILLLRIFIISVGLLLGFAASGLPVDKITIVLGALSVGIGLGLQGLVSNLVSGLIIAFERPVNVGDLIEFNGRSGTMKSIGFRSSVVTLSDGASLIVPNGDLLSNHVVNWSMARNIRRITIPVSVAFGTELKTVYTLLETLAAADQQVMKYPPPAATARKLSAGAVEIELVCWVRHPLDASTIAGNLITAIDQAFKENNIRIPYPQQDIHIHSNPDPDPNPKDA
jgi:small-conductance mechanosensitive channel